MNVHFKTLSAWPAHQPATPYVSRESARFTAGYLARLNLLEFELAQINAKDVVLEALITKRQVRADGWPLASASAAGPGVILSFTVRGNAREFPADNYHDWKDNLYAIAKTLEALRGIDRWGLSARGKQYQGFAPALPPPAQKPAFEGGFDSPEQAALFLAAHSGETSPLLLSDPGVQNRAYRKAAAKLHPDPNGGSDELFKRLQQAKALLDRHHKERR